MKTPDGIARRTPLPSAEFASAWDSIKLASGVRERLLALALLSIWFRRDCGVINRTSRIPARRLLMLRCQALLALKARRTGNPMGVFLSDELGRERRSW